MEEQEGWGLAMSKFFTRIKTEWRKKIGAVQLDMLQNAATSFENLLSWAIKYNLLSTTSNSQKTQAKEAILATIKQRIYGKETLAKDKTRGRHE